MSKEYIIRIGNTEGNIIIDDPLIEEHDLIYMEYDVLELSDNLYELILNMALAQIKIKFGEEAEYLNEDALEENFFCLTVYLSVETGFNVKIGYTYAAEDNPHLAITDFFDIDLPKEERLRLFNDSLDLIRKCYCERTPGFHGMKKNIEDA